MATEKFEELMNEIYKNYGRNVVSEVFYAEMDVTLADKTAVFNCPIRVKIRNSKKAIKILFRYINPDDLTAKAVDGLTPLGVFHKEIKRVIQDLINNDRAEFDNLMSKVSHDFFFINGRGQLADRVYITQ